MRLFPVALRLRALAATAAAGAAAAAAVALPAAAGAMPSSFLGSRHTVSFLSSAVPGAGPAAGDQNPYGVAVVPRTVGSLVRGDVLVSNFNNAKNQQGTGSSIVEISPAGHQRVFAVVRRPTRTPAVGLTTALVALNNGDVVVGSLPAPGGRSAAMTGGALSVINPRGQVVATVTAPDIQGPWDMTAVQARRQTTLFVTNVLNGTVAARGGIVRRGTVVRIRLRFAGSRPVGIVSRVIAGGFAEHTDPNALVVGPTGLGMGRHGVLYVADSVDNRIAAVPDALTRSTEMGRAGMTVAVGGALRDPLGLAIAPNGNILSTNGGNGAIVETRPGGGTAAMRTLVRNGAGDLFGIAVAPGGSGLYFVDDAGSGMGANSLGVLR